MQEPQWIQSLNQEDLLEEDMATHSSVLACKSPWTEELQISSVQLLTRIWFFATPWIAARQASLSITNSWSLPKLTSIEFVMPSNHLILCRPLFLPPSIFPRIKVFSKSQFFTLGGQSIAISASTSVLPMNIQDWFPLGLTGLISLQSKGLSRAFSNSTVWKHNSSGPTLTSILDYWKTIALTRGSFVRKVMSLLLNPLSGIA